MPCSVLAEAQEETSNSKETVGSLKQDLCRGPSVSKPVGAPRTQVQTQSPVVRPPLSLAGMCI